jgi:hypothetical protein
LDAGLSPVPKEGSPARGHSLALQCEEYRDALVTSQIQAEELSGKLADAEAARAAAVREAMCSEQELQAALAASRAELQAASAELAQASEEAARLRSELQERQETHHGDLQAEIAALRQQLRDRDQALVEERTSLRTEARALSEEARSLHAAHEQSLAQHDRLYAELMSEVASAQQSLAQQHQVSPRHQAYAQSRGSRQLLQPQVQQPSEASHSGAIPVTEVPRSPLAVLHPSTAHPQGGSRSSPTAADALRRTPKGALLAPASTVGMVRDGISPMSPREVSPSSEDTTSQRLQALEAGNQRLRAMQQHMKTGVAAVPMAPVMGIEPAAVPLAQQGIVGTTWLVQAEARGMGMGGPIGWR